VEAQLAGAKVITLHLREDRRHINDTDVERVKQVCQGKLNLEMAATAEMVSIARRVMPQMATLVPEGRLEVTTEGGLDVAGNLQSLRLTVQQLAEGGVGASAFVDPELEQIDAAAEAGFGWCELHTGPYAHAFDDAGGDMTAGPVVEELGKLRLAGQRVIERGMRLNGGHALNYRNIKPVLDLKGLEELHIGHSIISRAVFVGLRQAVAEMIALIDEGC
jgi:pyridoxine 5-phosphate synthase